jgi:hypothetical protein
MSKRFEDMSGCKMLWGIIINNCLHPVTYGTKTAIARLRVGTARGACVVANLHFPPEGKYILIFQIRWYESWLTQHSLFRVEWGKDPGLEYRDYGRGDPLRWPRDTLYQLKLALTSPAGCGRSVFSFFSFRINQWTEHRQLTRPDESQNKDGRDAMSKLLLTDDLVWESETWLCLVQPIRKHSLIITVQSADKECEASAVALTSHLRFN